MKKVIFIIIFFSVGASTPIFSQSLNLGFLVGSGALATTDYHFPAAINDSVNVESIKYKFYFNQALKTKMGIDLKKFNFKKMDAKASQLFLTYGLQINQPTFSESDTLNTLYRGEIGITGITASIRKGIWVYSGNLYIDENKHTISNSIVPNFRGFVIKFKIKSLRYQYFYGAGLLANQGQFFPFPIFGLRYKMNKKWKADVALPSHIKLNYKINKKVNMDLGTNFRGINMIYREGSALQGNDNSINMSRLNSYISFNANLGDHYLIKGEFGYSYWQRMKALGGGSTLDVANAPYARVSINYFVGKSVFRTFINKVE